MEHYSASSALAFRRRIDALLKKDFPRAVHVAAEPGHPVGGRWLTQLDSPRLSICLKGTGRYLIRRGSQMTECAVRIGEVIYVAPRCVMDPVPGASYLSLGLVFAGEMTRFLVGRKVPASRAATGHRFLDVLHTSQTLGEEGRHLHALLGQGNRMPTDRYLRRIMEALLLRARELLDEPESEPPVDKALFRWQAACRFIEDHLQEPISRDDVARMLRIHPNHISRLFARRGGESFKARVMRLRIERARELLRDPALNIAEVAHAVGFSDANYFTRYFHKMVGTTPGRDRGRQMSH